MKKYVLTGGPGIGKTTLIELLMQKGYSIVPEAARMIIEEEKLKGSDALPNRDIAKFQELVAVRQLELEAAAKGEVVFCDRSIIDGYGYCKLANVPPPKQLEDLDKGRYYKIFLLAPLNYYETDNSRFEHSAHAMAIHKAIIEAYKEVGYELIDVPVLAPNERVEFILKNL
ncbi:MAG TPA: ATP-binding protein [Candidatus Paceibacterota bacterium]